MLTKTFERTIPFVQTFEGPLPLLQVKLIDPRGRKALSVALLFDTGADQICLHPDYQLFFPNLQDRNFKGMGSNKRIPGKNTRGKISLLGQIIECEIGFAPMEKRTWMAGVIGRDCFGAFGFGFWQNAGEIYVTLKP
jgi:hypothetical protein